MLPMLLHRRVVLSAIALTAALLPLSLGAQTARKQVPAKPPLRPADITDLATLLKLEDLRTLDAPTLTRILGSTHPEVRRRAVMTLGRIVSDDARPLLAALHDDRDPEIVATAAWASGQQKDPGAVPWLGARLNARGTPTAIAKEAAQALGKIRTPDAHAALAAFLTTAPPTAPADVVGEALLSLGRFTTRDDLAPILRWTTSPNAEIRWRAAWALFRPRDPLAVPHLLTMSTDKTPEVRFWAVRGLTSSVVKDSNVTLDAASARLRQALTDPDRRVRTEAVRALVTYDDDDSVASVVRAMSSTDMWIAVSAAEALGTKQSHAATIVPALEAASAPDQPRALRLSALTSLVPLAPDAATRVADALASDDSATAKSSSASALRQLANAGRQGGGQGGGGRSGRGGARPERQARADEDYRALVETWIVPAYAGAPAPHAIFDTPRGRIDVVIHAGDAPFGAEYLKSVIDSQDIVGTEFPRVVPNFVAQEGPIRSTGLPLRDEVNRRGLLRGTLAWASAGLDTGRPGYTFASTPQPHNEGDFTALGTIVSGLDVVDHLELGDKITGARLVVRR